MAAAKKTHIDSMVEKDYLGAWDFAERDYTLEIDKVEAVRVTMRGGKKKLVPVITFKRARKKFIASAATNRDTLKQLIGPYVEDWPGKKITLYCDPNCKNPEGKGVVPGIRIRSRIGAAAEELPDREVDQGMRDQQNKAFEGREPGGDDR